MDPTEAYWPACTMYSMPITKIHVATRIGIAFAIANYVERGEIQTAVVAWEGPHEVN